MNAASEKLIHITGETLLNLIFSGENIKVKVQKESVSIKTYLSRKGGFIDFITDIFIISWEIFILVSQWHHQFAFPPTMYMRSLFSTSSTACYLFSSVQFSCSVMSDSL